MQIDGKCVIPTPLMPRVVHTPEEHQAMRGRRVIFLGLGGLDRGLAGMKQLLCS